MMDWDACSAVERQPGKVSGAWVLAGTRVPLSCLYENLASGPRSKSFWIGFPGWRIGRSEKFSNTRRKH